MTSRRDFLRQTTAGIAAAAVPAVEGRSFSWRRASGTVQTVRGPIDAATLGFTLPHEHILASSAGFWQNWPEFFGGRTQFIDKVVGKLKEAREGGVDTIVDVTPADIGRDIRLLEEVSRKSGIQIVAATGHWLVPSLSMAARSTEELTEFFSLEIERGIDGTGIKPGVIKVATDRDGVTPFLDKVLRAAARTSKATGVPITTHTFAANRIGEKQADIFESEGLDPASVCLGHCDDTADLDYLTKLARRGYTIGMDHLTWGIKEPGAADSSVLSWQQRADTVKKLIDAGLVERIFLSHDWYFAITLSSARTMEPKEKANPDGMLFNSRKVIPYLRQIGVTDRDVQIMTVANPRRLFGGA